MIQGDPLAAKPVYLESSELEKILEPEKFWLRTSSEPYDEKKYVNQMKGKIDRQKIQKELQCCRISFDAFSPTKELLNSFGRLVSNLKHELKLNKPVRARESDVIIYLKEFDHRSEAEYADYSGPGKLDQKPGLN